MNKYEKLIGLESYEIVRLSTSVYSAKFYSLVINLLGIHIMVNFCSNLIDWSILIVDFRKCTERHLGFNEDQVIMWRETKARCKNCKALEKKVLVSCPIRERGERVLEVLEAHETGDFSKVEF